jgi:hypothetical protein
MMVRILSLLPFATGVLCILIVLVSAIGVISGSGEEKIPIIPCGSDLLNDCPVGMSNEDLDIPTSFWLLDVDLSLKWDSGADAWVGIVDASEVKRCPPDADGLTTCSADDFTFLAGGPESQNRLDYELDPGAIRFTTGGRPGTLTASSNTINYDYAVGIALLPSILLTVTGIGLCLSGAQMAFPLKFGKKDD